MIKEYSINENDTIFIALSAFDDNMLFDTIRSCLKQALYPNLLYFGVVHYSLSPIDLPEDLKNNKHIEYLNFVGSRAPGVGITRNLSYQFYKNQSFYFQTDAHMYMFKNWDAKLLQMYKHIIKKHKKFVISGYMEAFTFDNNGNIIIPEHLKEADEEQPWYFKDDEEEYEKNTDVEMYWYDFKKQWGEFYGLTSKKQKIIDSELYQENYVISAACLFCDKETLNYIEPDPQLVFGEEPSLLFRLKSQDYKIFRPKKHLLLHYNDINGSRNIKANFHATLLSKNNIRIKAIFNGDILGFWGAKDLDTYKQIVRNFIINK